MSRFQLEPDDAVTFLSGLESESVALIVTDPAYESLEKHRAVGTTTRLKQSDASSNPWFEIFRNDRFPDLFREAYRVLAADAHFYVLCDDETSDVIKPMAIAAGFTWWKRLVWVKTKSAGGDDEDSVAIGMGYHYRNSHEFVCFLEKGKRRLNDLGVPSVLFAPRVRDGYPTEKPVSLLTQLIEQSSSPGELVVDPFTGSGSCGEAALTLGRDFGGGDIADAAIYVAEKRLAKFGTHVFAADVVPLLTPRAQKELFG